MTSSNSIRIFLWAVLGIALWLNYQAWYKDYDLQPTTVPVAGAHASSSGTPALGESVPQVSQGGASASAPSAGVPGTSSATPAAGAAGASASSSAGTGPSLPAGTAAGATAVGTTIHVRTDVLDVRFSLRGGTLVSAKLLKYPRVKGQPEPVELENHDNPDSIYVMQSGLTGPGPHPTQNASFTSSASEYQLSAGARELVVPLTWSDGHGVSVVKKFVFRRGDYGIELQQTVENHSDAPWQAAPYVQILRNDPPTKRSYFNVESYAFHGPAIYDGTKYRTLPLTTESNHHLALDARDAWIAAPQHHFVSAAVPAPNQLDQITLNVQDNLYALTVLGPLAVVAPAATQTFEDKLFVGPKLHSQLEAVSPTLTLVSDYGRLTILARPLFKALSFVHGLTHNWGVAIICVTFLLKLLFYPLSETSGRSMAKMKALAPRIKTIQETYKDDREKQGRAMMELYQREKVNPLTGCLPTIIQIPVFIAFYWVLLESVEMRQAPFFGWIQDLSSRDPYFILPLIMAGAMFVQYKLNPAPPDPVQARVMMIMPLAMSVMFAFFPAGLVLYWVTNTILSIAQQWNINRRIAAASAGKS